MDDEKLKEILEHKSTELISLEKLEVKIRNSVIDEDYTAEELVNRDRGARLLPEIIIYELRPLWQTATKLRIEIKCIKNILMESERNDIKNSRMRKN